MSKIYFEESYVIVEPSFTGNEMHRHSFLHVFVGNDNISVSTEHGIYTGSLIFTNSGVAHRAPQGAVSCILLVDPTSDVAENIQLKYLHSDALAVLPGAPEPSAGFDADRPEQARYMLAQLGLLTEANARRDERIRTLIDEIRAHKFIGNRVSEIAEEKHYSGSRLTHLFRRETGITLKGYLSLRQVEYVCQMVSEGKSITEASLSAGFSSPSHFSAVFKQMTGIALSDVL